MGKRLEIEVQGRIMSLGAAVISQCQIHIKLNTVKVEVFTRKLITHFGDFLKYGQNKISEDRRKKTNTI